MPGMAFSSASLALLMSTILALASALAFAAVALASVLVLSAAALLLSAEALALSALDWAAPLISGVLTSIAKDRLAASSSVAAVRTILVMLFFMTYLLRWNSRNY